MFTVVSLKHLSICLRIILTSAMIATMVKTIVIAKVSKNPDVTGRQISLKLSSVNIQLMLTEQKSPP